jgi:hypothetical protein
MTTLNLGLGTSPLGISPFGFGAPATANALATSLLIDSLGSPVDSRFIDPETRDYVIDSLGRTQGMSAVSQAVFLCLLTTLGSSAVATLGSRLSEVKTIDNGTVSKVQSLVSLALSELISSGTIALIGTDVTTNSKGIGIVVTWQDLASLQIETLSIP